MSKQFEKLVGLLRELFQLDQPDLDFGIYRIMHAKADELTQFLERDLLPQVKTAFSQYTTADKAELQAALAKAIEQATALGVDPESTGKVKELRQRLANESVDVAALEAEVYDHLHSFFRRYYQEGDFLAKRVYKPGVYAIPYEGEEVKLHWANRDQYYIKTSEYLRDYAFTLKPGDAKDPMRVHFRLVDAVEGEHGNVKAAEGKDRVFILATDDPIGEEDGELIIRFEYRPARLEDWTDEAREAATAAAVKKPPTQKELSAIAVARILKTTDAKFAKWIAELAKPHAKANGEQADYSRLQGHLNRYTARNTFDYFIHKDLGGFLRRELDFYIKNEVMHLDDVESETAARVEQYLSKIKVIRKIANKLIDFLAQLEDFQKKLWLKKKFVVETSYVITLDRIPDEFYPDIATHKGQREEWVRLFSIDDIARDLERTAYSEPLSIKFLKENKLLPVNTALFPADWQRRLLATLSDLDLNTDALLVHGENLQGMQLLKSKYGQSISAAYLDPPYNTDAAPISYKNGYRRSSWASLMSDRIDAAKALLADTGILCATIDDYQYRELSYIIDEAFGEQNVAGTIAIRSNPSGRPTPSGLAQSHEYAIFAKASPSAEIGKLPRTDQQARRYRETDEDGNYMWELFRKRGSGSLRVDRRTLYYPIYAKDGKARVPKMQWLEAERDWSILEEPAEGEIAIWPIDDNGTQRRWRGNWERINETPDEFQVRVNSNGTSVVYYKFRPGMDGVVSTTTWIESKYSATEHGTGILRDMFTDYSVFDFPKSVWAVEDALRISGLGEETETIQTCIDPFGGSGTTGHAVISLCRKDGARRRFILIEAEKYFDTVLQARLAKAAYSPDWANGRPARRDASLSYMWKIIRLESYEDALNNLRMTRSKSQADLLSGATAADSMKEQYMLQYMLNVETRGSPSLLNIAKFDDPKAYKLRVKRAGSEETKEVVVDLAETFNWLIGLTVEQIALPQQLSAEFKRDAEGRLQLKGRLKEASDGPWWFRTVTGATPDGRKTLVIWRKLTGDAEQDNLILDEWFKKQGYSTKDYEFDLIYVNGDNNLENLRQPDETWKVRLIEEDFHRLMFDTTGL